MMEETFFDRYDKRLQELMRANEDIEDLKKQNKRLGRKIERLEEEGNDLVERLFLISERRDRWRKRFENAENDLTIATAVIESYEREIGEIEQPTHPTELTTLEDYEQAPTGTIMARDGSWPWHKRIQGDWVSYDTTYGYTDCEFADTTRRVLRWGLGE